MNVSLTKELERFIAELVDSGRYRSASEVVRAGLRLLQQQEAENEARLEVLRKALRDGIEELDRGESYDGEEVFEEILSRLKAEGEAA